MPIDQNKKKYVPGMYAKKKAEPSQMADKFIREWLQKRLSEGDKNKKAPRVTNCICFSRKIGVGALEIADLLAEKTGFKVVDREILEHIASDAKLRQSTVEFFDERNPGAVSNFISMMFGERSFTMGDYMRRLASAVYSIADSDSTIFVGRAAHLILPREKTLAVRFISSKEHRVKRVSKILNADIGIAEKQLEKEDKLQREFFKKNFKKKDASSYEFGMVINRDYISEAQDAAELVYQAYAQKFGDMPLRVDV